MRTASARSVRGAARPPVPLRAVGGALRALRHSVHSAPTPRRPGPSCTHLGPHSSPLSLFFSRACYTLDMAALSEAAIAPDTSRLLFELTKFLASPEHL